MNGTRTKPGYPGTFLGKCINNAMIRRIGSKCKNEIPGKDKLYNYQRLLLL